MKGYQLETLTHHKCVRRQWVAARRRAACLAWAAPLPRRRLRVPLLPRKKRQICTASIAQSGAPTTDCDCSATWNWPRDLGVLHDQTRGRAERDVRRTRVAHREPVRRQLVTGKRDPLHHDADWSSVCLLLAPRLPALGLGAGRLEDVLGCKVTPVRSTEHLALSILHGLSRTAQAIDTPPLSGSSHCQRRLQACATHAHVRSGSPPIWATA